jgi:hypothetical protein
MKPREPPLDLFMVNPLTCVEFAKSFVTRQAPLQFFQDFQRCRVVWHLLDEGEDGFSRGHISPCG